MSEFSITRTVHIAASPQRVQSFVDDFRLWPQWSPWEDLDPAMQHTYSGAEQGTGARTAWTGNKQAGQGSMHITESVPGRVEIDLAFVKPFKATNHVRLDLVENAGGTDVSWTMTGQHTVFSRAFYKLFKMENKLAADFDKGLGKLKAVSEA